MAWDEIYCWPPTIAGQNVSRPCSEVMRDDPEIPNAETILGIEILILRNNSSMIIVASSAQIQEGVTKPNQIIFFSWQGVHLEFAEKVGPGNGTVGPTIINAWKP